MKNDVLCAVIETQIDTQLLFCIKVNKQMVKYKKYFAGLYFRSLQQTWKFLYSENWMTQKFPILWYIQQT